MHMENASSETAKKNTFFLMFWQDVSDFLLTKAFLDVSPAVTSYLQKEINKKEVDTSLERLSKKKHVKLLGVILSH